MFLFAIYFVYCNLIDFTQPPVEMEILPAFIDQTVQSMLPLIPELDLYFKYRKYLNRKYRRCLYRKYLNRNSCRRCLYRKYCRYHKYLNTTVPRQTPPVPSQMVPRQIAPSQMVPRQIAPSQMVPRQIAPSQMVPSQIVPSSQVMSYQIAPAPSSLGVHLRLIRG